MQAVSTVSVSRLVSGFQGARLWLLNHSTINRSGFNVNKSEEPLFMYPPRHALVHLSPTEQPCMRQESRHGRPPMPWILAIAPPPPEKNTRNPVSLSGLSALKARGAMSPPSLIGPGNVSMRRALPLQCLRPDRRTYTTKQTIEPLSFVSSLQLLEVGGVKKPHVLPWHYCCWSRSTLVIRSATFKILVPVIRGGVPSAWGGRDGDRRTSLQRARLLTNPRP